MELLTPQHIRAFRERFPLGSQEGQGEEALIVLNSFIPPRVTPSMSPRGAKRVRSRELLPATSLAALPAHSGVGARWVASRRQPA